MRGEGWREVVSHRNTVRTRFTEAEKKGCRFSERDCETDFQVKRRMEMIPKWREGAEEEEQE